MDIEDILPAERISKLTDGFEERQTLDIADGAADLDDDDVFIVRKVRYSAFDLVR